MNSLQSFLAVAPVKPAAAGARLPSSSSSRWARVSACLATPAPPAPTAAKRRELSAASLAVMADEAKYLVGTYKRAQVVFVSGRGCKLYDIDGREYLDMSSGIAVNALGYGDAEWLHAVKGQAGELVHASNVAYTVPQVRPPLHPQFVRHCPQGVRRFACPISLSISTLLLSSFAQTVLAKRLVESSFADRAFLANTGTEANEAAIKFARKYQRVAHPGGGAPTEFMSFSNCFHGRTMGSLALTSKQQYREPFEPVMPGAAFAEYGNLEEAKKVIRSGKIAAVFVEPVQGEGGIHSATKEFLQGLRAACDEAGTLLVFDEVGYRLPLLMLFML